MERLLATHDPPVTVSQFLALRAIARESLSAMELARRTGVSGAAVSQLLATLLDSGFLERTAVLHDRRRQALALSPDGRRVKASAEELLRKRLAELLGALPVPEADALAGLLVRTEAALAGTPPPRRPSPRRPPPRRPPPHR